MRSPAFLRWTWRFLLLALLVGTNLPCARAGDRAYWVWHRTTALTAAETTELQAQGVTTLYWHVASTREDGTASVQVPAPATLAPGFRLVPVVRLEPGPLPPPDRFLQLTKFAVDGALQLDFDSRDRQLAEYAGQLTALRAHVPHLQITALAHWPTLKDFPTLARSVEELCPMFYDLQNDPTDVTVANPPPPLLDPEQIGRWLPGWKNCPTRWRAGLPVFSRVTIFDRSGTSRGQIPGWEWDEIAFNPHLRTAGQTPLGVTLLQAGTATTISRRPVSAGDLLAVRRTDPAALRLCAQRAEEAGAAGTVLFRLPAPGSDATSSLRGLRSFSTPAPEASRLTLRLEGGNLVLSNDGSGDLPVRLSGERHDRDRGYALELDAPASLFREAEPGAFFRIGAHVQPDTTPRVTSVPTATRLTFWFSHLPAGGALRSGLFQLAPAATPSQLRWRVQGGDWQPLLTP